MAQLTTKEADMDEIVEYTETCPRDGKALDIDEETITNRDDGGERCE